MAVRKTRKGAGRPASRSEPRTPPRITVEPEQRRHLIEACAFFRAGRYRAVESGDYRADDVRAAAAEIDAVIARRHKRGRS